MPIPLAPRTLLAVGLSFLAFDGKESGTSVDEDDDVDAIRETESPPRNEPAESRGAFFEVRPMLALAMPVVISELGWIAMGLVDTVMVGRLGNDAIAAVGLGNVLFFGVAIFGIGILLGLDTLVSQSFGAGDIDDCHRSLVQGVYLAIGVSVPLILVLAAAIPLLRVSGIAPAVLDRAIPYLSILNWGLMPLMIFFAVRRYLQGMNLVKPILLAFLAANLVNWFGNWLLVTGRWGFPALGVVGSGWSTVFSRFAMFVMGLGYAIWHGIAKDTGLIRVSLKIDRKRLMQLIVLGLPVAGQLTLEVLVFAAAAVLAGRLGETALAAHEVVLQIAGTAFMVPLGIASAGAVRVGQAIGRKDPRGSAIAGWTAMAMGAGFMAMSALTMIFVPQPILGIFSTDENLLTTARSLLIAAAMFQVFVLVKPLAVVRLPLFRIRTQVRRRSPKNCCFMVVVSKPPELCVGAKINVVPHPTGWHLNANAGFLSVPLSWHSNSKAVRSICSTHPGTRISAKTRTAHWSRPTVRSWCWTLQMASKVKRRNSSTSANFARFRC